MSARKWRGEGERESEARATAAAALMVPRCCLRSALTWASSGQASACKPKQPALAVRWLVAIAAPARTVRWPFPEVKPRLDVLPAVRGSRASTDPGIPPDLLNPVKGLSMEKTAPAFLQLAMKFVPVAEMPKGAQLPQTTARETMIQRRYTLCEVM